MKKDNLKQKKYMQAFGVGALLLIFVLLISVIPNNTNMTGHVTKVVDGKIYVQKYYDGHEYMRDNGVWYTRTLDSEGDWLKVNQDATSILNAEIKANGLQEKSSGSSFSVSVDLSGAANWVRDIFTFEKARAVSDYEDIGSDQDVKVLRFLFFLLGALFFWGMLNVIFPNLHVVLKALTSFVVSYLFIGYILPGELLAVIQIYSVTGLALIAVLPLFVLISFSASMIYSARVPEVGAILMERFAWMVFLVMLCYKTVELFLFNVQPVSKFVYLILVICLFVSFYSLFRRKEYMNRLGGMIRGTHASIFKFSGDASQRAQMSLLKDQQTKIVLEMKKLSREEIRKGVDFDPGKKDRLEDLREQLKAISLEIRDLKKVMR